jgi:heat-inducible transcriptional repressor
VSIDDGSLDERKLMILKAVVEDYIESFEPVGSRTVAKKYDLGLSSATIRNEMADLEEMGYLCQPHTSAGRVPSSKGYRMYVDKMLAPVAENPKLAGAVVSLLESRIVEYHKLIKAAAEIISEMTQYTAIGMTQPKEQFIIKAMQIVPVDSNHVLAVVVAENNVTKSAMVELDSENLKAETIISLSGVLNDLFSGRPAESISLMMINEVVKLSGVSRDVVLPIIDAVIDCIRQCETGELYTEGAANLLKFPEFDDIDKAREFIDLIQDKETVRKIAKNSGGEKTGLVVTIGGENGEKGMDDYSVVSASYNIDGECIGTISVLGPTRMDYSKVISSLEYMQKMIEKKAKEEGKNKVNDGKGDSE